MRIPEEGLQRGVERYTEARRASEEEIKKNEMKKETEMRRAREEMKEWKRGEM